MLCSAKKYQQMIVFVVMWKKKNLNLNILIILSILKTVIKKNIPLPKKK